MFAPKVASSTVYRRAFPSKSSALTVHKRAWPKDKRAWSKNFPSPSTPGAPAGSWPWGPGRLSTALIKITDGALETIGLLAIQQKSLDRALFLYIFIH